ncbi:putative disulfide formation protein [Candidatus Terasakiella magnetica]|uniref:Putative disulfide formation protein n=1 Tax=Candidatus Terasakiella magnetica TaxID=1867952 RepID=A0A1C3RHB8_9PROT|nr:disulfide bond formation protein B [Candidatus Terasakiella magnetica]SCA56677.1 putative disulfide formation protein [Candidatus Terasakiella magnetica]
MSEVAVPKKQMNALILSWVIALMATLSALFIGEVLGKTPCLLCWYQRIAMFPLALILGVASYTGDLAGRKYALPLIIIGTLIAAWHSLVFAGIVPAEAQPCSQAGPSCSGEGQILFGILPLPYLSLLTFLTLLGLLTIPFKKG